MEFDTALRMLKIGNKIRRKYWLYYLIITERNMVWDNADHAKCDYLLPTDILADDWEFCKF